MKISVVTVCFNSAATIEDTIKSVLGQSFKDIEYIIVDGGSTDGTLQIINKYKDKIAKIISGPDQGLYDAMNKGVSAATGDVIGIINSDDFYANEGVIENVVSVFNKEQDADAIYGDLEYVNRKNIPKIVRRWPAGKFDPKKLPSGWIPPHPSLFVKRTVYERFGVFNTDFKIAADYEFMLRCIYQGVHFAYLPEVLVKMREGGFSGRSLKQRQRGWRELRRAWQVNGLAVPPFFIARRLVSKLTQYL